MMSMLMPCKGTFDKQPVLKPLHNLGRHLTRLNLVVIFG
jgi:hypothetical protein